MDKLGVFHANQTSMCLSAKEIGLSESFNAQFFDRIKQCDIFLNTEYCHQILQEKQHLNSA